jgi:hypothetical protein
MRSGRRIRRQHHGVRRRTGLLAARHEGGFDDVRGVGLDQVAAVAGRDLEHAVRVLVADEGPLGRLGPGGGCEGDETGGEDACVTGGDGQEHGLVVRGFYCSREHARIRRDQVVNLQDQAYCAEVTGKFYVV